MDREARGATVTGVANCRTRLKRLSTARVMHVRIYFEYIRIYETHIYSLLQLCL